MQTTNLAIDKQHDEAKQGEAFAPFVDEPNLFQKKFYIESYGCAMNFADSEVVASILYNEGYGATKNVAEADVIFVNTCSIREKAELTIRKRLTEFRKIKVTNPSLLVGVLGCMAERLKSKFIEEEKLVDLVIGPDAYRTLPTLIQEANGGQKGVNVLLSRDETYADISPIRLDSNGVSAFVSIMRGCNNMCSFCVVPFTRGRERSRDAVSIINESKDLFEKGYKEITLLGQNVDSYHYTPDGAESAPITFANLLAMVAQISPLLRVRFSTSHPKDITDEVLYTIAKYKNICNYIHLPVQSGSTRMLQLMNRTYTREWYLNKIDRIREIVPTASITSDVIAGFCTETEADHQDTITLMQYSKYELSYMYYYSERPGTLAARRFADDIPLETKKRRLQEIVDVQGVLSTESNKRDVGKTFEILIDGDSKKSVLQWAGRNEQNKTVIFDKENYNLQKGDYVMVEVLDFNRATLFGKIVK
jgi:tRNA-2-methylthio-N6-dimethylallyladenosine synthase